MYPFGPFVLGGIVLVAVADLLGSEEELVGADFHV